VKRKTLNPVVKPRKPVEGQADSMAWDAGERVRSDKGERLTPVTGVEDGAEQQR
jgi:hypothetical protein